MRRTRRVHRYLRTSRAHSFCLLAARFDPIRGVFKPGLLTSSRERDHRETVLGKLAVSTF